MRILIRTSKWATWARRLGSFALPLTVIPIFMHRGRVIPSQTFEVVELFALAVALLALFVSLGAFSRIWITGDLGWGRAIAGFLFSLVCLVPAGIFAVEFLLYPWVDEVSTDAADPPPLISEAHPRSSTLAELERLATVFPNVRTRSYPLSARQTFGIVDKLVTERGWDVRLRRQPLSALDSGQINAIATSLVGFREEVSIRIAGNTDDTSVAMRSAALDPIHEPGEGGARVEEFLTALDVRITQLMRDGPAGASSDDAEAEQAPVAPTPAPAPRGRKH